MADQRAGGREGCGARVIRRPLGWPSIEARALCCYAGTISGRRPWIRGAQVGGWVVVFVEAGSGTRAWVSRAWWVMAVGGV